MKFRKTSRTPFLQNTSSSCFCQKRLQHKCLPVKFTKFFRTLFFTEHLRWLLLNGQCCLVRYVITRLLVDFLTFSWFLACFKDIFDFRILFPELVAKTKHYLLGFDAIQFFLSNQCFSLLITTIQNIYISNENSQKKEKQQYKLKVLIFKLLNDSYMFKVPQKVHYNIFLCSRIGYWGHLNDSISIL